MPAALLRPGVAERAALRKTAVALKLPTLLRWFKPDSQALSQEQWRALSSQGVAPRELQFGGVEVDSSAPAGPPAQAVQPAQAGARKRSRR